MFSFTNKKVIGVGSSGVHCGKSMESQMQSKKVSENIRCALCLINIFLYFTTLYITKTYVLCCLFVLKGQN